MRKILQRIEFRFGVALHRCDVLDALQNKLAAVHNVLYQVGHGSRALAENSDEPILPATKRLRVSSSRRSQVPPDLLELPQSVLHFLGRGPRPWLRRSTLTQQGYEAVCDFGGPRTDPASQRGFHPILDRRVGFFLAGVEIAQVAAQ